MQDSKVERPSYNSKQETAGQGVGFSTQIPRGSRFGPESDLLDGYQGSISGYGSGLGSDLGSDLSSERDKNWFQRQRFQNAEHGASSILSQSDYDGHVRIGSKAGSTTWTQPPASHKLAYQSEIRDLIRSYHDLAENADSDSSVQEEDDDVLMADYSTEYEYQGVGGRKNVTFTQDFTNATTSNSNNKAFRSAARRNASFKTAVKSNNIDKSNNYHLSNNIVKEISRSMESIHDGFRSLSRVNSISSSQRSLRSETGSIRSYSSTGGTNNKRLSRSQEILETRFEPSKSNLPKQQRMRPELRSKSATGLNLLARGLKPRNQNRASKGPGFGQRELRR
ncbi:uncharacterized protein LOC111708914 [Eurytemora carolleeae]|uniref:uncharacterized protein LOC111708914 n=1 Tax=Eurytemora carolleeae TaxID=1294199 RepID=UPI000C77A2C4|nr:uncharacterized protein LOC111708914 [Eurytemora carolleeae]|eukprot:XP_023338187.1 uncharacterized protein LOC111708914 [Eurytemora affinis]